MKLFLVQCCKAKKGRQELFNRHRSVLSDIPTHEADRLVQLRARVKAEHADAFGGPALSALSLYTGHFYDESTKWLMAAPPAGVRFLIMSGGYGLVRPDEIIEDYDVHVQESYRVWIRGFTEILAAYIRENGISSAHGIVSRTGRYRDLLDALRNVGVPVDVHTLRYAHGGAQREVPRLQAKLLRRMVAGHEIDAVDGVAVEHR